MHYLRTAVLAITMIASILISAQASAPARSSKTLKVLTVGNSFSQNASHYVREIAAAAGHDLVMGHADIGGCWLGKHWKAVEMFESDPNNPDGKPYAVTVNGKSVQKSLREILTSDKWDIVTIQQYSVMSHDLSTYQPYARNLRDYIKKHAPQAEVVIHETWAYRCDDPGFAAGGNSQEKMYRGLSAAYRSVASELGVRMISSGDAFYAADTDKIWRYKPAEFDPAHAVYPDLPDQTHSLHVGWYWTKNAEGKHELGMDGHHANANGCYLAGCVWFEMLFGESVVGNTFRPENITPGDARYLQHVAHESVRSACQM